MKREVLVVKDAEAVEDAEKEMEEEVDAEEEEGEEEVLDGTSYNLSYMHACTHWSFIQSMLFHFHFSFLTFID